MNNQRLLELYTIVEEHIDVTQDALTTLRKVKEELLSEMDPNQQVQHVNNEKKLDLEDVIALELRKMHVSTSLKGYKYMIDSIKIIMESKELLGVTKNIYPLISNMRNTTPSRIERAIRSARQKAYEQMTSAEKVKYFGTDSYRPRNAEFLHSIAENLKIRQKETLPKTFSIQKTS